jgi:hypothetical protein
MRSPLLLVVVTMILTIPGPGDAAGAGSFSKEPEIDDSVDRSEEVRRLPTRSGEEAGAAPVALLPPAGIAARDAIADMAARNEAGVLPAQNGFSRALPERRRVVIETPAADKLVPQVRGGIVVDRSADGGVVTMLRVHVEGAWGVRLHLEEVALPKGTVMWVYGQGQEPVGPFGHELLREQGDLYCPTVFSETVWLEVETPPGSLSTGTGFVVADVMELFPPAVANGGNPLITQDMSCLVDATCVSSSTWGFDGYERAVTFLVFSSGGSSYICSGGMVVDTDTSTSIPYVLTANHCFDSQATASTVESYWDYQTSSCGGSAPSLGSLPRVTGATLLATSDFNDFTFIRLSSRPSGRLYLGWDENLPAHGTTLHRISHPDGKPQNYSRGAVDTTAGECTGRARPEYLYSRPNYGGTFGGSSGSPVILYGGYVVGQLRGGCGPNPSEGCDYENSDLDGAFQETYRHIRPWLDPGTGSCVEQIELDQTVNGTWTSVCTSVNRSGAYAKYYTFSVSSSSEVQIDLSSEDDPYLILLEGSGTGGRVIASDDDGGEGNNSRITQTLGAGSYTIEATTYYASTTGSFTLELTGSGGGPGQGCTADATTLCLNNDRFKVRASWRTREGTNGQGQAVEMTADTGYLWFFNQNNVEMVIKVLDACGVNSSYWVFAGGLTDVQVDITVTDTSTGAVRTYHNSLGTPFQPIQHTSAFGTCP